MTKEVHWSEMSVTTDEYRIRHGHDGATVWFTGLSGAGKSTLAMACARVLFDRGVNVVVLDADNVRHGLNVDLGFGDDDRAENVRRLGEVALLMAAQAQVVLVTAISPFAAGRLAVRRRHTESGVKFVEVHVATSAEECTRRDTKGLYARVADGTYSGLSGVDAPYEMPESPDVRLETQGRAVEECVTDVLSTVLPHIAIS
ncbi:MAG: hypothetical protein RLY50_10 [Actinomycetota bacterium]|jgi:adenylyl-sulfate kinase